MSNTRSRRIIALSVALAVFTTAGCSSSGDSADESTDVSNAGSGSSADAAPEASDPSSGGSDATSAGSDSSGTEQGGGGDTDVPYGVPAPSEGLADYGKDDNDENIYTGPGNFSVDLMSCPADWDINAGITDSEINLFTSMPHSGALAAYGYIGDGIVSYLKYVNENGGIDGRKINLDIMDDQYQADLTRKNVDDAVAANKYAASFSVLGSSNNGAVRDVMNSECMGQFLVASSEPRWGDPENYPWTTGMGLDYYDEANLWAEYLKGQFPDGAKIEVISINNDLGATYVAGFERAVAGTNLTIVQKQTHDPAAPNLDNQITTAAAGGADALVMITAGTFCTQGLAAVEKSSWDPVVVTGNSCAQVSTTFQPLIDQGLTGNGTNLVRYYYSPNDVDVEDKKFAQLYTDTLTEQGLDPTNSQFANGWFWGWYIVATLQNAAQLKGGLNRANILIAAHAIDQVWPLMVSGVTSKVSGVEDAYLFESGQVYAYQTDDPKKVGSFVKQGEFINTEGELKNWPAASGEG